jgi:hypothetical protein
MKKREREIAAVVQQVGLQRDGMRTTGTGHYAVTVTAADGTTKTFFFAKTPSDHRADLNNRGILRRFAQEHAA